MAIFDFTELEFEQTSDNDYAMNGNIKIRETVDGPISIKIETKKLERGEWVSTYFNQFFPDICEEMAKEDPQKWVELFKMLTPNGLCPFVEVSHVIIFEFINDVLKRYIYIFFQTLYPFEDYRFESDSKATKMIPPTLYGEYMSEFRIQVIGEDDTIKDISCAIAKFELARHD